MGIFNSNENNNTSNTTNERHVMSKTNSVPSPQQANLIGEGTTIEGTVVVKTDVHISGRIVGKVRVHGRAFLTQEGEVEGELIATNADLAGRLKGQVEVKERVMLKGTAHIEGEIQAGRVVMEEGAVFNGQCSMGDAKSSSSGNKMMNVVKPAATPESSKASSM
jgi:cytoskeletal protein CcmA (bactofilin family)